jgi:hypothetical protein
MKISWMANVDGITDPGQSNNPSLTKAVTYKRSIHLVKTAATNQTREAELIQSASGFQPPADCREGGLRV